MELETDTTGVDDEKAEDPALKKRLDDATLRGEQKHNAIIDALVREGRTLCAAESLQRRKKDSHASLRPPRAIE